MKETITVVMNIPGMSATRAAGRPLPQPLLLYRFLGRLSSLAGAFSHIFLAGSGASPAAFLPNYCSTNQFLNPFCKPPGSVRRGGYQPPACNSLQRQGFPASAYALLLGRLIAAPTADGRILLSSIHVSIGTSIETDFRKTIS